jgi:hypothetical protein
MTVATRSVSHKDAPHHYFNLVTTQAVTSPTIQTSREPGLLAETGRPSHNGCVKQRKQRGSKGPQRQLRSKMLLRAAFRTMSDSFGILDQSTFLNECNIMCNDIGFRQMFTHQTSRGFLYLLFEPLRDFPLLLNKIWAFNSRLAFNTIHLSGVHDTLLHVVLLESF